MFRHNGQGRLAGSVGYIGRDRARPSIGQWRAPLRRGRQAVGRTQERSDADPAAATCPNALNTRTGVEIAPVPRYHAIPPIVVSCGCSESPANSAVCVGPHSSDDGARMESVTHPDALTFCAEAGGAWATPVHDATGNMTVVPQPDAPASACTLTWDAWNRLVKVADGTTTIAEYAWDGSNRRVVKKTYAAGVLDETRHIYLSRSNQVLEERFDSSTFADRQFTWGTRYIDDLVLRTRDTDTSGTLDETVYALQDANWNVVALVSSAGTVVERFRYTPYGRSTVLDANFTADSDGISDYDWEYRFTSREYDSETALHYFRARFYHDGLGRFIGRDPLEFVHGGNLYAGYFVLNAIDPSGTIGIDYGGTRVTGSLGCIPVGWGMCLCITYEVFTPITHCECQRLCSITQATVNAGLYICGSTAPHRPQGRPRVKMLPIGPGRTPWPVPNFPFVHGVRGGCPKRGCTGTICVTWSIGWWGFTVGCRMCWYGSGGSSWSCGTNIGTGTGVSVGGGITCTACK